MNPKKVRKVISGILSPHWYRTIRLELIRTQTKKYKQSILRKKYWIESYMDNRGKPQFQIYRKEFVNNGIVKKVVQISKEFNTLAQAERFIFKLTDKELKTIVTLKEIVKNND